MRKAIENRIAKLEGDIYSKSIGPPAELVPYLNGKDLENEDEVRKISQIYNDWLERIDRAMRADVTLGEILDALPEPYRTGVVEALIKSISKD